MPHKLIIAVIDDDPAIRDALSSLIRSSGYRVRLFAGAEQFLRENAALPADCIITDIQMPGMNGLELQRRLEMDTPETPVIMITAFPEEVIRDQALKAGARAFLSKPFDAATILDCLANALNPHR